jgi:two-component system chemotaxis response regulator CheB
VIRVLLADDSSVVRDILRNVLETDPELRIVGEAKNGREAVEMALGLKPDIMLMDVRMPVMDGIEATSEIMSRVPVPILVVSAGVLEDTNTAFRAIQAGAIDVVQKPVGTLAHDYRGEGLDLIRRVKLVARVPPIRRGRRAAPVIEPVRPAAGRLVLIGASTGGPPALATILGVFPKDFPAPILAVQHISKGFLQGFVDWLDSAVPPKIVIAERGSVPQPGTVHFAPEDKHLEIGADGRLVLTSDAPRDGHRPSATTLFESAAQVLGPRAVGVLLTGMGRDGATGLKAMRDAGAVTICQDEESCVVFGMPAVAIELGAASVVVPVEQVGAEISRSLG